MDPNGRRQAKEGGWLWRGVWVADTCRLFMDCTVVVQAGNWPWGLGLGEG
jgi:hypothetical protein